jgi:2-dehydropantoate 2-reductase
MTIDVVSQVVGAHRSVGAVIEIASNMYVPGIVNRQNTIATSWFAVGGCDATSQARANQVADVLRHAGRVQVSDDIRSAKWMKLVVNAGEFVPSAIPNLPLAEAVRVPGMHQFMLDVCREAVHTAVASGNKMVPIFGLERMDVTDPDRFVVELLPAVLKDFSLPDTRTTVLQDWDKGRHSEVDEINGLVVQTRARLAGSAPANERTVKVAHRIESGTLAARPDNVALLLAAS